MNQRDLPWRKSKIPISYGYLKLFYNRPELHKARHIMKNLLENLMIFLLLPRQMKAIF